MIGPAVRYVFALPTAAAMAAAKTAAAIGTVWGVSIVGAQVRSAEVVVKGAPAYLVAIALPLGTAAQRTRALAFDGAVQRPTLLVERVPAGVEVWPVEALTIRQAIAAGLAADPAPVVAP